MSDSNALLGEALAAYLAADPWNAEAFARAEAALGDAVCHWAETRLLRDERWDPHHGLDGILRIGDFPDADGAVRLRGGAWILDGRGQPIEAIDVTIEHAGGAPRRIRVRLGTGETLTEREIRRGRFRLPDDDDAWSFVLDEELPSPSAP